MLKAVVMADLAERLRRQRAVLVQIEQPDFLLTSLVST
jgi:hypothetical protein